MDLQPPPPPSSAPFPPQAPAPPPPLHPQRSGVPWGCLIAAVLAGVLVLAATAVGLGLWLVVRSPNGPLIPDAGSGTSSASAPAGRDSTTGPSARIQHVVGPSAELAPAVSGDEAAQWAQFVRLFGPGRIAEKVATVSFYDKASDDSDASVTRTTFDPQRFDLEINLARSQDPKEQAFTFVHEFAHTISLSGDQVPEVAGACPRLRMEEGCARPGSYLQDWQTEFWDRYGATAPTASQGDEPVVRTFYEAHRGDFVDEYAATNVTEDFAETFAFWVVTASPAARGVAGEKVARLEARPELVALRDDIRAQMETDWLR